MRVLRIQKDNFHNFVSRLMLAIFETSWILDVLGFSRRTLLSRDEIILGCQNSAGDMIEKSVLFSNIME